jgi:hypothetical protein
MGYFASVGQLKNCYQSFINGGVICMGEMRNEYKIFNVNLKGMDYLEE